jgi:hypothetical protein
MTAHLDQAPTPTPVGRPRAARALLAVPALAVAAFGGQLLVTGWADREPGSGHQVQDLAWGSLEGVLLLVALVVLLRRPRHLAAALQALAVVAALLLTMLLTVTLDPFTLVLGALVVAGVALGGAPVRLRGAAVSRPAAALAGVAAVALLPYAAGAAAAQRGGQGAHVELLGYTGATAWALGVVLVAAVAAFRLPSRRLPALSVATAVGVVGLASVLWPDVPSSLGAIGGGAALAWAAASATVGLRD